MQAKTFHRWCVGTDIIYEAFKLHLLKNKPFHIT